MTSQQILQSDLLDILFEGRNKMYGAYWLRSHYNNHLLKAIGGTTLFIAGLFFFINPSSSNAVSSQPRPGVVITTIALRDEKLPEPPKAKLQPPPPPQKTVILNTNLTIVDNPHDPIATQDILLNALPGSEIISGPATLFPPALPPEIKTYSGNGEPAEKSEVLVSRQPQFPGGSAAWLRFLERYLQAPQELEPGERRTVLVRFSVDEEGSVTGFQVVKSGGDGFDNEVIRVLKKMPKWMPALQSGKAIAVSFTQPVTFAAQDE